MKRLRDKMREDLVLRGMAENTITTYLGAARRFVEHFNQPLSALGEPELRSFLLHLVKRGAHPQTDLPPIRWTVGLCRERGEL